nr:hypothetical protein [uncultured bacterium]
MAVFTDRFHSVSGIAGFGSAKLRLAGSCPCRIDSATLISPAAPAAASRCPMFVFTDPTSSARSAGRPAPSTAASAAASTGSPTRVPVPCSSTYWTCAGSTPARV